MSFHLYCTLYLGNFYMRRSRKTSRGTPDPPPPLNMRMYFMFNYFIGDSKIFKKKKIHPGGIPSLGLFDKWKNNLAYQGLPQSTFYQPKELKRTCNQIYVSSLKLRPFLFFFISLASAKVLKHKTEGKILHTCTKKCACIPHVLK